MANNLNSGRLFLQAAFFLFSATCVTQPVAGQKLEAPELRLWQDVHGNEVTARLVRYREGIVYLRTNTRQSIQVPPAELSAKDQKYVVERLKAEKKEKLVEEFERLAKASPSQRAGGSRNALAPGGSGNAGSSEAMADNPSGFTGGGGTNRFGQGGKTPRGNAGAGVPGSQPPMRTRAGDAPITFGGDPNRTPSPYTRTPDSEETELDSNPQGGVRRGKGTPNSNIDPFANTELNRPDLAGGVPGSSSSDYLGGGRNADSKRKTEVKNANIDPFAELNPVESANRADVNTKDSPIVNNPFEDAEQKGYQPPVLPGKLDGSASGDQAAPSENRPGSEGISTQTAILIGIGIVSFLILVMISLLVMVLVKSNRPQRRRRSSF